MGNLGASDIDSRLEEQLIDGILYAFQEQTQEDIVMLNGFGTVVNALGKRVKAYLPQICGTVLWRLNNKSAKVRQQAADLISRIAQVMMTCGEVSFFNKLKVVLSKFFSLNSKTATAAKLTIDAHHHFVGEIAWTFGCCIVRISWRRIP